ncbi:uncharacterized protein EDB93DRAFT_1288354 [Suillus bovinus]|uniref:uncharacterized protein n=1 Tax=Suillus bovinus TaxID=48563 RepID=UPI001B86038B|nr:uncharacterized protein EDB93DRAFT_1288354 [Suillus bovinus]KAG2145339.1 hypothetical protein EDB93DRAFT_1288354 [Suillus bovinus]
MALQSRPVPMNASSHHSKVKVSLTLSDPIFVAGNNISGKMEVECLGDGEFGLGIGLMMVELFAVQEITSRDCSGTSTFIHSRRLFQGPGLPPSNAIQTDFNLPPGESTLPAHYYPARRGLTTFFFRFPLPPLSPASISFGPAQIRYEIRASVDVAWRGEKRLVTDHQYVNVVEHFDIQAPSKRPQGFAIAEGGNIWAQAFVTNGPIIAGGVACVDLQLKNHSVNWTCGVTLTLSRELRLLSPSVDKDMFKITDTVTEVEFRGHEYMVPPGVEGVANLVINIPLSSRGSHGGARVSEVGTTTDCLFEVCCNLRLRIDMPIGSEPVIIIIPLFIHHPLAVPQAHTPPYAIPATSPQPYASPPTHPYLLPPSPDVDPHFSSQQYDLLHAYWPPPSQSADYKPLTPAFSEQYSPRDLSSSNPHFQHYTPLLPRPASIEPHSQMPYYDTGLPSGLPISAALLPRPPISSCPPQAAESSPQHLTDLEEGKGARASRISRTLRLSSRHRSVSPLSHRFSLPQPSAQYVSPSRPHPSAIQIPTLPNPHDSQGVLHSPRPIPSPKQSYSGPSPRSENVCALERMADEVGKHSGDLSADLPKSTDYSAPKPELEPNWSPPPTAPLAAITPVKFPRAPTELSGLSIKYVKGALQESGLDALERRLLAEVGTRCQDASELRPDVCSVVQPIKIPASEAPAGVNSSTISSLTLADHDAFPRSGEDERERDQDQDHDSDERTQHRGGRHSQSDDECEVRTQRGWRRIKGRHNEEDDERQVAQKREWKQRRGKEGDVRKLRSEVKGRIAAWLGEIDTSPPLVDDSLSTMSPTTSRFVPTTDNKPFVPPPSSGDQKIGGISFGDNVSAAPNPCSSGFVTISTLKDASTRYCAAPAPEYMHGSFDAEKKYFATESLAPGPILRRMSTGQSTPMGSLLSVPLAGPKSPDIARADPISTVTRHFLSPHHLRHSPQPPGPEVKYDVHSARGGKGGRVTEVASLWAAKADTTPNRASQLVKKPVNHGRKLPVKSHGPADTSREGRGKATKATTVPAVISSSHAVPMLSSTASLARASPNTQTLATRPLPPMISETISNLTSVVKTPIPGVTRTHGDLGFGQARLRDLIKKYQG